MGAGHGDFNGNSVVDINDLLEVITMWGSTNPMYDLDASGSVEIGDLLRIISGM